MQNTTETTKSKVSPVERARLRRNQRNSRARKQDYIQDLERRWAECVRLGVQASEVMQKQARRVHEENAALRSIIHDLGLSDDALQQRLQLAMDANSTLHNGASTASHSSIIPTPPAANTNANLAIAPGLPSALDQMTAPPPSAAGPSMSSTATDALPSENRMASDDLQTWDLSTWLNDLSNIHYAYGVEAQSQFDYDDAISHSSGLYPVSGGMQTAHVHLNQGGTNNAPTTRDNPVFGDSNGMLLTEMDNGNLASSGEIGNTVPHIPGSMSNDLLSFPHAPYLGNGVD